jgi:hypothetical protein
MEKQKRTRHTFESICIFVAEKYGGKCLNIKVVRRTATATAKFGDFQCANGHMWTAPIGRIVGKTQSWCGDCLKRTIGDAKQLAIEKGGVCLSEVMNLTSDKLTWCCSNNHQWLSPYDNIRTGHWCPTCMFDKKRKYPDAATLAASYGGQSLTPYTTRDVQMRWRCKAGHEWSNTYAIITQGIWCSICANNQRLQVYNDMANTIASSRGGKCLSAYIDRLSPMHWECNRSHKWSATYNAVTTDWCVQCYKYEKRLYSQENANKTATKRGGKCLSVYENINAKMIWECAKSHQWSATYNSIKNANSWCPKCATDATRLDTAEIDAFMSQRGGKRISEYINCSTPIEWECKRSHRWFACYGALKNAETWCPHCRNKSESNCREIFEQLFDKPFPNIRLDWLRNPEGNKLELDGACFDADVQVAFEFQGAQHYEVVSLFKGTEETLKKQQLHDAIKVEECAKRGITLIVIPYTVKKYKDKCEFIVRMLQPTHPNIDINKIKLYKA